MSTHTSLIERIANAKSGKTKGNVPTLSIKCVNGENDQALLKNVTCTLSKSQPKGYTGVFAFGGYVMMKFVTPNARDDYVASLAHHRTASAKSADAVFVRTVFGQSTEATELTDMLGCTIDSHGIKHRLIITSEQLLAFTSRLGWNGLSYDVYGFSLTTDQADNDANYTNLEAYDQAVAIKEEQEAHAVLEQQRSTALALLRSDEKRCREAKGLSTSVTPVLPVSFEIPSPVACAVVDVTPDTVEVDDMQKLIQEMAELQAANVATEALIAAEKAKLAGAMSVMRAEHATMLAKQAQLKATQEVLQAATQVLRSA